MDNKETKITLEDGSMVRGIKARDSYFVCSVTLPNHAVSFVFNHGYEKIPNGHIRTVIPLTVLLVGGTFVINTNRPESDFVNANGDELVEYIRLRLGLDSKIDVYTYYPVPNYITLNGRINRYMQCALDSVKDVQDRLTSLPIVLPVETPIALYRGDKGWLGAYGTPNVVHACSRSGRFFISLNVDMLNGITDDELVHQLKMECLILRMIITKELLIGGDNIIYRGEECNITPSIRSELDMGNYESYNELPWIRHINDIIDEGIVPISSYSYNSLIRDKSKDMGIIEKRVT